jgi:hypothetical protein
MIWGEWTEKEGCRRRTFAANAMHRETRVPVEPSRVVIMPNLQAEMNLLRSSTFSLMETSSMFLACDGISCVC